MSKSRTSPTTSLQGCRYSLNGVEYPGLRTGPYLSKRIESLVFSKGHKWPPKDGRDHGGPFLKQEAASFLAKVNVDSTYVSAGVRNRRWGDCHANAFNTTSILDCPAPSSLAEMMRLGTTGVARSLPTNPLSGLAQFLGELHEVPKLFSPKQWKKDIQKFRRMDPRVFASKHLEYQFGWIPLVSDIKSFYKVTNGLNKQALQYERDSGRNIRRSRTVLDDSSATTQLISSSYPGFPGMESGHYSTFGRCYQTIQSKRKVWFSGCFTYYLPPCKKPGIVGEYAHYEAITNKLFGIRITPETLWQLTPWSWAIDWVSNAGDVIHNWQAFQRDGLIMRYGYIMERKDTIIYYDSLGAKLKNGTSLDCTDVHIYNTLYRQAATPYGFGLDPSTFTDRQNSIIAALAIQRLR